MLPTLQAGAKLAEPSESNMIRVVYNSESSDDATNVATNWVKSNSNQAGVAYTAVEGGNNTIVVSTKRDRYERTAARKINAIGQSEVDVEFDVVLKVANTSSAYTSFSIRDNSSNELLSLSYGIDSSWRQSFTVNGTALTYADTDYHRDQTNADGCQKGFYFDKLHVSAELMFEDTQKVKNLVITNTDDNKELYNGEMPFTYAAQDDTVEPASTGVGDMNCSLKSDNIWYDSVVTLSGIKVTADAAVHPTINSKIANNAATIYPNESVLVATLGDYYTTDTVANNDYDTYDGPEGEPAVVKTQDEETGVVTKTDIPWTVELDVSGTTETYRVYEYTETVSYKDGNGVDQSFTNEVHYIKYNDKNYLIDNDALIRSTHTVPHVTISVTDGSGTYNATYSEAKNGLIGSSDYSSVKYTEGITTVDEIVNETTTDEEQEVVVP